MTDSAQQTIYLKDYKPFSHIVEDVHLTFSLAPDATRVKSKIRFTPTENAQGHMFLHGEDLKLLSAKIDGQAVSPTSVSGGIECETPDTPFLWEAEVEINPAANTALEGLYMSNGMYCTQCEAEGFRKITYYPDRPDVMSTFSVRIESDLPVMLSNGNPTARGDGFAQWHDPWPKPAYLFAIVAGDLRNHPDSFTTRSGKKVDLNIWVRPGPDEEKCAYGMGALKRSMKWDEDTYGREYDLDVFNIVAVDDFNMGAMENKGLNIFNSSCVLASAETATDPDFKRVEAIIAHEYFHNWTGNRITCRDWFQLCLKEGLTVFRDQQFTGDLHGHAVKRIDDTITLRARQFREDNGPLAHPVRPESFVEINNFYTATVYEKGAEVIGMLKRIVGDEGYYKALDLYFERHDGDAATIEDWLQVFEDATGRDLTQFKRWYSQAGTPRVSVEEDWNDGTYRLTLRQETPPTPGQAEKDPFLIPVAVGLLSPNGDEVVPTQVLELSEREQSFTFDGLGAKPTPSILRGFSAPVILTQALSSDQRAFLMAHDTDPFNKWEAGRALAKDMVMRMVREDAVPDSAYLDALLQLLRDERLDPAFKALALALPSQDDIAQSLYDAGHVPDPTRIYRRLDTLAHSIAEHLQDTWPRILAETETDGPYSPNAQDAGKRALANAALQYLSRLDGGNEARRRFARADNMTDQLGSWTALLRIGKADEETAQFREKWHGDRLVMHKWFGAQIASAEPENAASVAKTLTNDPDFDWKNPNRFRAVFGSLSGNAAGFHHPTGEAYRLTGEWLARLDAVNPQITAKMVTAFETWKRYDQDRQDQMRDVLETLRGTSNLSRNTKEMVDRLLEG